MKWVQRWENWLMTPFSTDRVSLGRPAICGGPGWVGGGSHKQAQWGSSYPQPCAPAVSPSPYCILVRVEGSAQGLNCQDLPPCLGLTPDTLLRWASCLLSPNLARPSSRSHLGPRSPCPHSASAYCLLVLSLCQVHLSSGVYSSDTIS